MPIQNYAIVNTSTNLVVNVSLWDGVSEWSPGPGLITVQDDDAIIGQIYNPRSKTFSDP